MPKAVALYLRLSQEDVDVRRNAAKDESNSISAQRKLLTGFILLRYGVFRQMNGVEFVHSDEG